MEWVISQHHFLSMLQTWSRKLDAFLLDSNLNLSNRDLQAAALLKIHWLVCTIGIEGTITPTKFSTPDFTTKFQKIVALCKSIVAAENAAKPPQFSMEYGIIGPLYFMALNCQDPDIRRQVLEVLSTPRSEGMWDSQVIAYILDRIERERVPSLNRNDSSTPQQVVITAEMSNRPLGEVIETARSEMRMLGGYEPKMRTNTIRTEAKPESIRWEIHISLEPNIERPYTLQFNSESLPRHQWLHISIPIAASSRRRFFMYESSGSKMDSKFFLIFDSGVDILILFLHTLFASILRQRRRLKNRGYMKKQMHVVSVMIKSNFYSIWQQVALIRAQVWVLNFVNYYGKGLTNPPKSLKWLPYPLNLSKIPNVPPRNFDLRSNSPAAMRSLKTLFLIQRLSVSIIFCIYISPLNLDWKCCTVALLFHECLIF